MPSLIRRSTAGWIGLPATVVIIVAVVRLADEPTALGGTVVAAAIVSVLAGSAYPEKPNRIDRMVFALLGVGWLGLAVVQATRELPAAVWISGTLLGAAVCIAAATGGMRREHPAIPSGHAAYAAQEHDEWGRTLTSPRRREVEDEW